MAAFLAQNNKTVSNLICDSDIQVLLATLSNVARFMVTFFKKYVQFMYEIEQNITCTVIKWHLERYLYLIDIIHKILNFFYILHTYRTNANISCTKFH